MHHDIYVAWVRRRRSGVLATTASVVLLAASACSPPAVDAQAPGTSPEVVPPAISGVRAHLFQNKKGEWSDDILDPKHGGSWNAIAGPNASNATLVVVEVSGPPGGTYTGYFGRRTKYMVRLVAREGERKVLLDQTQGIPVLNDQGKVQLAFLLHQSGCASVRLTASVVGAQPAKPVRQALNFACGE